MMRHLRRVPMLALGLAAILTLTSTARAADAKERGFHWEKNEEQKTADLKYGDQPVLRYMHAYDPSSKARLDETYKVYHHVFGPGTGTLITKGAGGLFPHHRGLYVGWNKTQAGGQSYDFWHCTKGAHQKHVAFKEMTGDAESGTMTAEIHWNDADGKPVIVESRTVTVSKVPASGAPGYGWQIDWSTKLESRRGEIELTGDRQHAGFQYRAAQSVAESKGARYVRPEAFPQQPEAVQVGDSGDPPAHINLGWFAMTSEIDGKRYTVEYFEDPSLPKPSLYSERPYGRFGAFFKAKLTEEKPLEMQYRLVVTTGETPERDAIQKRYDEFVSELKSGAK